MLSTLLPTLEEGLQTSTDTDARQGICIALRELISASAPEALEDYEETWNDEQIVAAMKEPPQVEGGEAEGSSARAESASLHSSSSRTHHKRPSTTTKEPARPTELGVYRGAVECPICFLVCSHAISCDVPHPEHPSTTQLISIILVAATKLSAPNASFR